MLDCSYLDLHSPAITFRDGLVVKTGDVVASVDFGLAVVKGAAVTSDPAILWEAEALFMPGHC